jgi:hypothetical protein
MKTVYICAVLMVLVFSFASAHAQCPGGVNASCVTGFSIAPGSIPGDEGETATATVTAHL